KRRESISIRPQTRQAPSARAGRILTALPTSAASGRLLWSWKAPSTRSLERQRYVAHAFQRAGSGGFPAARRRYSQDSPVLLGPILTLSLHEGRAGFPKPPTADINRQMNQKNLHGKGALITGASKE